MRMRQVEERYTPQELREYEACKIAYRDINNSVDTVKREGIAEGMEKAGGVLLLFSIFLHCRNTDMSEENTATENSAHALLFASGTGHLIFPLLFSRWFHETYPDPPA